MKIVPHLLRGSMLGAALLLALGAAPALAQSAIDFGDDSGRWANDGECDDPRFFGDGGAFFPDADEILRDATDCRTNYQAGSVRLLSEILPPDIDFGDDSGRWTFDLECDDPRFVGEGMSGVPAESERGRDAFDCSRLFAEGWIELAGASGGGGASSKGTPLVSSEGIDFGNDSGRYANDGECDDPRFTGPGASQGLYADHLRADATDCRTLFERGQVTLAEGGGTPALSSGNIDFGNDSGRYANDGECDDPRFTGPGASAGFQDHIRADATDCRTLYETGRITLADGAGGQQGGTPAVSSGGIDYGNDSGRYANDGECDDPRFTGPGASAGFQDHIRADATDCRTLFERGQVTLIEGGGTPAVSSGNIDFGNDSGRYANDGECDDPRFTGPGASSGFQDHIRADATDCRTLYGQGQVRLVNDGSVSPGNIDFGNDSGRYANDGECDDPRFTGPGASSGFQDHIRADATDCRTLFERGQVTLVDSGTPAVSSGNIDFGNDSGRYANDGECDDPRFVGPGASAGFDDHIRADATDCRTLFERGQVTLVDGGTPAVSSGNIDFGNDSGRYANDGECDDPRFVGPGASAGFDDHIRADATDCRTLFERGQVTLAAGGGNGPSAVSGDIDFGDDSSRWANDGECDDPRFTGPGMAHSPVAADTMRDATDCRTLYEAGRISQGATTDGIHFGEDTSRWANDGECDDPRFEGDGMAAAPDPVDTLRDATDCRTLYEAGRIRLSGSLADTSQIDFGTDSSQWANDGECDDPRFVGDGMATELVEADMRRDASDCRALYEAGRITLRDAPQPVDAARIDFGNDSSQWANDGECDDPRFTGPGMAASPIEINTLRDATDCRTLFLEGRVRLASTDILPQTVTDIDFGDDTGRWANDGECDDPRFTGPGASMGFDDHIRHDAADCRNAFLDGRVTFSEIEPQAGVDGAEINFGNDTGRWANDGECDDPRFEGVGMGYGSQDHIMRDATDCRENFEAGRITLIGDGGPPAFDFGSDTSRWANDGQCDDPRFSGPGTNKKADRDDMMADATDCRTLLEQGEVEIRRVYDPAYVMGAPYDSSGVEFGNNTSNYANDGECDDPRFEGPGTAYYLLDTHEFRDAADCRSLFEAGLVVLAER